MGRKEFYEKIEELDRIRKNMLSVSLRKREFVPPKRTIHNLTSKIEHQKLLLHNQ